MSKIKLNWAVEKRNVSDLVILKENPRLLEAKKFSALVKSLDTDGNHDVIKIDINGDILSGVQRTKALKKLGMKEVYVLVPSRKLTQKERDRVMLGSNLHSGDWDFEKLKSFDLDLLLESGFDKVDLSDLWTENLETENDQFNESEELAKIKKPKTKLGDLISMGQHRLICGDSTDPLVLKKLFGKERASAIYSDPVYNINYRYDSGLGQKNKYGAEVQDTRTYEQYKEFLKKSMLAALSVAKDDLHIFYYSDQCYIGVIQELYRELGIENKRVCLWVKNSQNPTVGVAFSKCYEPCTYGIKGRPWIAPNITNLNEVMNKEITTGNNLLEETLDHLDLWLVKRLPGKDYEHATSKPPKLHEKALRRCTKPGDIILDSFSGSASTMIAAEQLKRRVYAVELEPVFCDLAIKRFEKLTGLKAKIIHEKN